MRRVRAIRARTRIKDVFSLYQLLIDSLLAGGFEIADVKAKGATTPCAEVFTLLL
jgi:hypothetical protein